MMLCGIYSTQLAGLSHVAPRLTPVGLRILHHDPHSPPGALLASFATQAGSASCAFRGLLGWAAEAGLEPVGV